LATLGTNMTYLHPRNQQTLTGGLVPNTGSLVSITAPLT